MNKTIIEIEKQIFLCRDRYYTGYDMNEYRAETLLAMRKRLLDEEVLNHIDKYIDSICEFDKALTDAFRELYKKSEKMKKEFVGFLGHDNFKLLNRLFLGDACTMPHATDQQRKFWVHITCDYLLDSKYFSNGICCAEEHYRGSHNATCFEETSRYHFDKMDEFLNKPLSTSFYFLYEESHFALLDFIYSREFRGEMNIQLDAFGLFSVVS